MLSRAVLAEHLHLYAEAKLSVDAFEDWFEENSWNVHQAGDDQLTAAVFRVESWLTAHDDGRLQDAVMRQRSADLANAILESARLNVVDEAEDARRCLGLLPIVSHSETDALLLDAVESGTTAGEARLRGSFPLRKPIESAQSLGGFVRVSLLAAV